MAKKLIFFITATIMMLCSCRHASDPCYGNDVGDSVYVAQQIESTLNPSFTSSQEVQAFQDRLIEEYSIDEIFRTLPRDVINNVANVCLRQVPRITKKGIVDEYRANQSVYDNLPKESTEKLSTKDSAQHADNPTHPPIRAQGMPTSEVSYRYETDTINGKPVRIMIKEERIYE